MTALGGAPDGPEDDNTENKGELQSGGGIVSPFAAILLLVPADSLLHELRALGTRTTQDHQDTSTPTTNPTAPRSLAGPLAYFIRHLTPTKTLLQLSRSTCRALSLADLQLLATHLVSWRRARPLAPPLNVSHIYTPSPNADFRSLRSAEISFARAFPMLPGLVALLAKLGRGPPTPFVSLVPSSDHKAIYLDALAHLVRGGWVVQLRTFAWVRVNSDVKRRVRKEDRRHAAAAAVAVVDEDDAATITSLELGSPDGQRRRVSNGTSDKGSLLSPGVGAVRRRRPISDAGSASSVRTAIPISALSLADDGGGNGGESPPRRDGTGAAASSRTVTPSQTLSHRRSASLGGMNNCDTTKLRPKPSSDLRSVFGADVSASSDLRRLSISSAAMQPEDVLGDDLDEESPDSEPSIILSPHRASAVESRWLARIASDLRDKEARETWPRLVKYFDGRHALEEIAAREGLKRKLLAPILARLISEQEGCLMTVRHW